MLHHETMVDAGGHGAVLVPDAHDGNLECRRPSQSGTQARTIPTVTT